MSLPQADAPEARERLNAEAPERRSEPARPYGLLGLVVSCVLIFVGTLLIFAVLAALVVAILAGALGLQTLLDRSAHLDPIDQAKLVLLASMPMYAALTTAVLLAARIRGGRRWRDIVGFSPWHPLRGAAWVWGLMAALIVWGVLANNLIERFKPGANPLDHLPEGLRWRFVVLILAAVFAPIAEEMLFRGWIYTSLRATVGVVASVLIVSVLFAAAHWEGTHLLALAIFPVAVALAVVRERTGSVKATILMHAVYNGFGAAALFFTK